jgi:hypothetical protein
MGKYVFAYYEGNAGGMTMEEVNAAWGAWFGELGDKIIDAGNPFNDGGMAVEKSGVSAIVNFPSTGYSIIKADTMEEATDIAKGCPVLLSEGAVRVYEALPM